MRILEILNQAASTNSPIEKAQILNEHKNNQELILVCKLAYDPTVIWNTTHTEKLQPQERPDAITWTLTQALQNLFKLLPTRRLTGNLARREVELTLARLADDDYEVAKRVILKDLRTGFGESIINKVWPESIPTFDFLLAETDPSGIVYPAISQLKADGMRCAMFINALTNTYSLMSRQGKAIEDLGSLKADVTKIIKKMNEIGMPDVTLDGELICFKGSEPMDRQTSNGILNKALRGTISEDESNLINYQAWDIVDRSSKIPYNQRFNDLGDLIVDGNRIHLIETVIVSEADQALAHFKALRRKGREGTILKNVDGKWVPKRSKDLAKFKAEFEAEFKVTGFLYGTGKNAKRIGKLSIESQCGLVKCNVGIFKDFKDSVRDEWMTDMPKIVTIRYNDRSKDKDRPGIESLFLPRVISVRLDKDTANTREEMIEIEKATLA